MNEAAEYRTGPILLGGRGCSPWSRMAARAIDLLLGLIIFLIAKAFWEPLGPSLCILYVVFQDSMGVGQSFGKRIMGVRVIEDPTELTCDAGRSCIRNLPFALIFLTCSFSWLWIFFLILVCPVLTLEVYLLFALDSGNRLGDILANTRVLEYFESSLEMPQPNIAE